ncbi:hypothetical protein niasHT_039961 [Heterodera trifolii]|uniref:Uncharacterized protein n=1 Tax=Heterodera trifolii TaxID=157864 RepID=A0ABD2IER3_9BILA
MQHHHHHLSCAFWADQLSICKSDRDRRGAPISNHKGNTDQRDDLSLQSIAENVLSVCLDKQNVPVGCLVAEFLFRNGKRFDVKEATKCQITLSGYLNSLKNYNNKNSLALGQILAQILPQFGCSIPLHSLAILVKILKANLHDPCIVQLINSNQLVHLWHHCFYVGRGPNELNKSIAKNLIAIFKVVGPAPIELFKHFLFQVPYFIRHKYLLMQYLLSTCSVDQLNETILLHFFDQLTLCLEGHWCEAELADAFHAMALRFMEMNKSELLVQSISNALTSQNETIRENAVRLWFPKLSTSQLLRKIFSDLRELFRFTVALNQGNTVQHDSEQDCHPPYWFCDSIIDPTIHWSCQEINLWAFLQLVHWATKNQQVTISDAMLLEEDLDIVVNALIGCHKDEIKKIAADALALILARICSKKWHSNGLKSLIQQLASNFECLMQLENINLRNSINSIFFHLFEFYDQEIACVIKSHLHKLLKKCSENNESTNFCFLISNLLHFIGNLNFPLNDKPSRIEMQNFLLTALVYEHDSTIRQQSAQMAFKIAKDCADFKSKLITLFNKMAPKLKYGIVHLYRLFLCLKIDQHELDLQFIGNDDGLKILFTRTKLEQSELSISYQSGLVDFLSYCIKVNEKLLQFGGSDCEAQCVTVSELHLLFENISSSTEDGENDDEFLFWSDTQKKQLSIYSNGIIQSCSAIRWILTKFTAQMGEEIVQSGLRSIWTVLLRSHHKGVLEHCGSDFYACVEQLSANFTSFPQILEEIVEKTLSILSKGGGQCRNIAFAKILLPIFASIGPIQRAEFISRIISFDYFDQNSESVSICGAALGQTKLHLHQLFLLKELVSTTKFDLMESREKIFQFIMRIVQIAMKKGQTERWRLFSMAGNAFAALLHSIFRHLPAVVPLNNFYTIERQFCDNLLISLRKIRLNLAKKQRSEPSISLLLFPLQRLFVFGNPIENCCSSANQFIVELSSELYQLISLEPSFLLRAQMAHVINQLNGKMPTTQTTKEWHN